LVINGDDVMKYRALGNTGMQVSEVAMGSV
jgi:aryl-alcohol dehydrogenase-like predicted oxidoreductase